MRQFYKILKRLKNKLPTSYPVLVYIVDQNKMKDRWGECYFTGKRFVIRIAKGNWAINTFILLHEYSHALCSEDLQEDEWHGDEWGFWYAKCWKVYVGEDIGSSKYLK